MLQVLQYFVGTSMAAVSKVADLTIVHSVVGGAKARGSSEFSVVIIGCKLRGRICSMNDEQYEDCGSGRVLLRGSSQMHVPMTICR